MARFKGDPAAMIRGWVEIAKMCGLYESQKTRVEISTSSAELGMRIREMGDEELLALASAEK